MLPHPPNSSIDRQHNVCCDTLLLSRAWCTCRLGRFIKPADSTLLGCKLNFLSPLSHHHFAPIHCACKTKLGGTSPHAILLNCNDQLSNRVPYSAFTSSRKRTPSWYQIYGLFRVHSEEKCASNFLAFKWFWMHFDPFMCHHQLGCKIEAMRCQDEESHIRSGNLNSVKSPRNL